MKMLKLRMSRWKLMAIKVFKWRPLSKKQKKVMTWWTDSSPYKDHFGIIADGSIRSGKTVSMSFSFVLWAMSSYDEQNFAMCGKTIGAFKRNVWKDLKKMLHGRGYKIKKEPDIEKNCYSIRKGNVKNYFYIFGGRDESSQDLIQGITLAGLFLDEVALMPESFVDQGIGRCSVEGRKIWVNCNPKGPKHWFKEKFIDKAKKRRFLYLHFTMDDNLSLSEDMKKSYAAQFEGLFFLRYIKGLWAFADGLIYSMFNKDVHTYKDGEMELDENKPYERYYVIDYGTVNPFACLEVIKQGWKIWVDDEYYYDSKKSRKGQKDDSQYVEDMIEFIGDKPYRRIIVDPSAASFKAAMIKKRMRMFDANNDVEDGIRLVSSLITIGLLKVNRDKCPNLITEFFSYIWDEKAAERGKEQPSKQFDHALDALRYFCNTIIKKLPKIRW